MQSSPPDPSRTAEQAKQAKAIDDAFKLLPAIWTKLTEEPKSFKDEDPAIKGTIKNEVAIGKKTVLTPAQIAQLRDYIKQQALRLAGAPTSSQDPTAVRLHITAKRYMSDGTELPTEALEWQGTFSRTTGGRSGTKVVLSDPAKRDFRDAHKPSDDTQIITLNIPVEALGGSVELSITGHLIFAADGRQISPAKEKIELSIPDRAELEQINQLGIIHQLLITPELTPSNPPPTTAPPAAHTLPPNPPHNIAKPGKVLLRFVDEKGNQNTAPLSHAIDLAKSDGSNERIKDKADLVDPSSLEIDAPHEPNITGVWLQLMDEKGIGIPVLKIGNKPNPGGGTSSGNSLLFAWFTKDQLQQSIGVELPVVIRVPLQTVTPAKAPSTKGASTSNILTLQLPQASNPLKWKIDLIDGRSFSVKNSAIAEHNAGEDTSKITFVVPPDQGDGITLEITDQGRTVELTSFNGHSIASADRLTGFTTRGPTEIGSNKSFKYWFSSALLQELKGKSTPVESKTNQATGATAQHPIKIDLHNKDGSNIGPETPIVNLHEMQGTGDNARLSDPIKSVPMAPDANGRLLLDVASLTSGVDGKKMAAEGSRLAISITVPGNNVIEANGASNPDVTRFGPVPLAVLATTPHIDLLLSPSSPVDKKGVQEFNRLVDAMKSEMDARGPDNAGIWHYSKKDPEELRKIESHLKPYETQISNPQFKAAMSTLRIWIDALGPENTHTSNARRFMEGPDVTNSYLKTQLEIIQSYYNENAKGDA
jgi:hypothetical protein